MASTTYITPFETRARVVIEPEQTEDLQYPAGWTEGRAPGRTERHPGRYPERSVQHRPAGRATVRRQPLPVPLPVPCAGSAAPSLHGSRLTRRGRVVVAMAWLLLIVAGAMAFVRPWDGPAATPAPASVSTVQVQAGDTLWELAGDIAPTADLRETVAAIMELNGLSSATDIRPGDTLTVPAGR